MKRGFPGTHRPIAQIISHLKLAVALRRRPTPVFYGLTGRFTLRRRTRNATHSPLFLARCVSRYLGVLHRIRAHTRAPFVAPSNRSSEPGGRNAAKASESGTESTQWRSVRPDSHPSTACDRSARACSLPG